MIIIITKKVIILKSIILMKNYTNMFVNIKILNPDIINIEDIVGDSNCLYHSISYFFTGSESNYPKYRYEIYIHALNKRNTLPNIYI